MVKIGIIGGSGLDNPQLLKSVEELSITTPYGKPSDTILKGKIGKAELFILPRHGKQHHITPTKVNNKANIYAMKQLQVDYLLSTTACGSLQDDIERGDIVILDQFIDFTKHRDLTFHDHFKNGINHTPMAEPFNKQLRTALIASAKQLRLKHHEKGTVITIEGPRFSTRAESKMFRILGGHVVNMSVAPECILANELGIPYASIGMVTDYDSWNHLESSVSWDEIKKTFGKNTPKVKDLLLHTIKNLK